MTSIIYVVIAILFLVLIGWTWSNLSDMDKNKKIAYILASILITAGITFVICLISQSGMKYENEQMRAPIRNLLVAVFTPLNGFVIIQYIARILGRVNDATIDQEEAKKKFTIILVIFIVIAIIEFMYMKNIQYGILNMYNSLQQ